VRCPGRKFDVTGDGVALIYEEIDIALPVDYTHADSKVSGCDGKDMHLP